MTYCSGLKLSSFFRRLTFADTLIFEGYKAGEVKEGEDRIMGELEAGELNSLSDFFRAQNVPFPIPFSFHFFSFLISQNGDFFNVKRLSFPRNDCQYAQRQGYSDI